MEGGKHTGNFADVMQPGKVSFVNTQKQTRNRIIVGAVIGLITLVTLAVAVGLAVYFGIRTTLDENAWKTYHITDGHAILQKTEVKDDETHITVANAMIVIYDNKNELEVYRLKNPRTERYYDCYVKPLNDKDTDFIQEDGNVTGARLVISQDMTQNGVVDYESSVQYTMTSTRVQEHILSDSVSQMCQGGNIYWLKRIEIEDRIKRSWSVHVSVTHTKHHTSIHVSIHHN